jgi:hypothetical protein
LLVEGASDAFTEQHLVLPHVLGKTTVTVDIGEVELA